MFLRVFIKEATASISGDDVFGNMKYEAGVHRVQRVPVTEGQGRVHTSTVTVAILPQPTEVKINPICLISRQSNYYHSENHLYPICQKTVIDAPG